MGRLNLFEMVAEFHKTYLEGREDEEPRQVKIPKPQASVERDVRGEIALSQMNKREGEDIPMVVESSNG